MRKLLFTALIGYLLLALVMLEGGCKHAPLFDDDDLVPIDTSDTSGVVDTLPTGIPCDPDSVYFETDVLPILVSNCAKSGCHDVTSHQEDVVLNNYSNVMQTGDVSPFSLGSSDLYEAITETDPEDRMPPPPNTPLTQAQIQIIAKWINQGAQDLHCDPNYGACDTSNVRFSQTVLPVISTYCKGCHSGASPSGNINLETYDGIKTVAQNGKLYGVISWSSGFSKMPQGGNKLDACTISKFKAWIDAGALNN